MIREIKKRLFGDKTSLDDQFRKMGFTALSEKTENDVYIMGYPKSGTTLMKVIVGYLAYGITKPVDINLMHQLVTEEYNFPYYLRLGERHFFKNHELPKKEYKNVIYCIRDGRDAILSYYHMLKNTGKSDLRISDLYQSDGKTPFGNWNEHVQSWLDNPFDSNIIFIKYEDMLTDKVKEIEGLASFLGIENYDAKLIAELTSFESMRKMENGIGWSRRKKLKKFEKGSFFVRKGKVGEYSAEVDGRVIDEFDTRNFQLLRKLGY
ncbi:sulfotransferase domain-containing protein [Marivirga sp.]|uniref:sulfotransferase domain-containing protein n=1 Tax=Marivirga sp. TaxID=2018662 RepID=UPI0025FAA160|nr:sulfotransferase domain-containing protein [Marivirga sp.]